MLEMYGYNDKKLHRGHGLLYYKNLKKNKMEKKENRVKMSKK